MMEGERLGVQSKDGKFTSFKYSYVDSNHNIAGTNFACEPYTVINHTNMRSRNVLNVNQIKRKKHNF